MEKYVAFIDILGFKEKIKIFNQDQAERYIVDFSQMLYDSWKDGKRNKSQNISGYIFSDSIIVYSKNDGKESLQEIVEFLIDIYKKAFSRNRIFFRGGLAKGDFNKINGFGFDNLTKGLLVGKAFVEAYTMESQNKGSVLQISENVKNDIEEYLPERYEIRTLEKKKEFFYFLDWLTADFFIETKNFQIFLDEAIDSKWLPHYYETIYQVLTKEEMSKRMDILKKIYEYVDSKEKYIGLDIFIKNAFSESVNSHFQKMFLNFLRKHIIL